jgi:hypothetical protein
MGRGQWEFLILLSYSSAEPQASTAMLGETHEHDHREFVHLSGRDLHLEEYSIYCVFYGLGYRHYQ